MANRRSAVGKLLFRFVVVQIVLVVLFLRSFFGFIIVFVIGLAPA